MVEQVKVEQVKVGDRVTIKRNSGPDSDKSGTVVAKKDLKTQNGYRPIDWTKEVAVQLDEGDIITMFKNRLVKN